MFKKRKLVSFIIVVAMIFTMVPGEAWAAKGAADLRSTDEADGRVNMANLESQLWALDETTEQRDLIRAQAKKNEKKNLKNRENITETKALEKLEKQRKKEAVGENNKLVDIPEPVDQSNLTEPEDPISPVDPNNPEPPIDPDNPSEPLFTVKSIDKIPMQIWDEKATEGMKPKIVVRDASGNIMTDEFYQVTWENNKQIGKAKVTVTGVNGANGKASRVFYIIKSLTPEKLTIKKIETDLGRARIYFDGTSVGNMKIRYEVRCKKAGEVYEESFNFQSTDGSVVVNGLDYNKKYEFRVKAYYFNDAGDFVDGPLSNKVVKWTNRRGDREQTIVKAKFSKAALGKSSVKLSIKKVKLADKPNMNIGYRIIFRIKGYSKYRYVDTKDLTKTFYNLDRGVDYQFRVKYYYISKVDGKRVYSENSPFKSVRLSFRVNKVLDIARSWLGRSERRGTHKYIIDLYNSHRPLARGYKVKYTDEWCATTVSAMFIKAKAVSLPGGTECSVQKYIDIYKKRGVWEENGCIKPKAGYVICYNWDDPSQRGGNNGWADHIGIVEKVRGNKITVIEGNYGERVARRTIPVGWGYIRGYAKLKYATQSKIW